MNYLSPLLAITVTLYSQIAFAKSRLTDPVKIARECKSEVELLCKGVRPGGQRRRDDARHRQFRGVTLEVPQRRDLEIDGAFALAGGGDLQDVARAIRGRDPMVLVALAVERRELAFQAPELAGAVFN